MAKKQIIKAIKTHPVKAQSVEELSNVMPSLHTSWSEIWCDWLRAEKHKTDVTFSLWLQENYEVPSKKQ